MIIHQFHNFSSEKMLDIESILPPHWYRIDDQNGETIYVNDISGETSRESPYQMYLRLTNQNTTMGESSTPRIPTPNIGSYHDEEPSNESMLVENETNQAGGGIENDGTFQDELDELLKQQHPSSSEADNKGSTASSSKTTKYEYHCQWNERDLSGKVSLYGLTIRYLDSGETSIRFDGINGEWVFASLKGPYGCLDRYDLFIGAKVNVFGRHLTISSANTAACQWNEAESQCLVKQQELFRKKIESVGEVPCVRKKVENGKIGSIARGDAHYGKHNLRMILKDNAKLGEQLFKLGLALK